MGNPLKNIKKDGNKIILTSKLDNKEIKRGLSHRQKILLPKAHLLQNQLRALPLT
jgi:hypothetical protein